LTPPGRERAGENGHGANFFTIDRAGLAVDLLRGAQHIRLSREGKRQSGTGDSDGQDERKGSLHPIRAPNIRNHFLYNPKGY